MPDDRTVAMYHGTVVRGMNSMLVHAPTVPKSQQPAFLYCTADSPLALLTDQFATSGPTLCIITTVRPLGPPAG